jgi:hypothetical protein
MIDVLLQSIEGSTQLLHVTLILLLNQNLVDFPSQLLAMLCPLLLLPHRTIIHLSKKGIHHLMHLPSRGNNRHRLQPCCLIQKFPKELDLLFCILGETQTGQLGNITAR